MKTSTSLSYVNQVILPVLTAMFDHLAACDYGSDMLLDEIQVASYKILAALYTLGIDGTLHNDRKYLKTEIERNKPVSIPHSVSKSRASMQLRCFYFP